MCGFVGLVRFDKKYANLDVVNQMLPHVAPRGPDGCGVWMQGAFACGHRRLQIIDLSEHAAQPMVDSHLGLTLVFNGTIYNYPELREELKKQGYQFFSHGDSEVVLKAYHAWGEDCVKRFNGMFAFVIWEHLSEKVFLARDRLGIKPLYYTRTKDALYFASHLPALLAVPELDKSLDPIALNYYLSLHAVVPAPKTIIKSIEKLPPAHWLTITADQQSKLESYWSLAYAADSQDKDAQDNYSEQEWQEKLQHELMASAKRRLVADVPVGVLLSGGVDSSLLVGLLAELGVIPETFSIGFETVHEDGNEYQYSDLIANHYQTKHHKTHISHAELLENLSGAVHAMSEPMVSHDVVGFYLLGKEVSKHIKVVQSGQGADEVFAGYHWYPKLEKSQHAQLADNYAKEFFDRDFKEYSQAVQPAWINKDYVREFVREHFDSVSAHYPLDKVLHLDTTVMLVEDPVKRVDNMTMNWGLEARVPFLDHELVELAAKIPYKYKLPQGGKHILKEVARKIIPHGVIDRPKGYFPVPALKYLEGPYLQKVKDLLLSETCQSRQIFNSNYVQTLLDDPKAHITPLRGSKLWQMGLLEFWLQQHNL